jgi:hypothetical protein
LERSDISTRLFAYAAQLETLQLVTIFTKENTALAEKVSSITTAMKKTFEVSDALRVSTFNTYIYLPMTYLSYLMIKVDITSIAKSVVIEDNRDNFKDMWSDVLVCTFFVHVFPHQVECLYRTLLLTERKHWASKALCSLPATKVKL